MSGHAVQRQALVMSSKIGAGEILSNRYRIIEERGRGGKGIVFVAEDTLLKRKVAIKILHDTHLLGLDTKGRSGLLSEARSAAQLNHPNIVNVYDVNQHEGTAYVVMEMVDGLPLSEYKVDTLSEILSVAVQICTALDHAHRRGVVHRDLKPENVLVLDVEGRDGYKKKRSGEGIRVKLVDFGLARSATARLTTEGVVGTANYLAPEQALGQAVDARADLYSFGVMLYELCTGKLPFTGDDPLQIISQHIHAEVVPPKVRKSGIPEGLNELIVQLLQKSPGDRPGSAWEVLGVLEEIARPKAAVREPAAHVKTGINQGYAHNLPIMMTRFIGRGDEINEITTFFRKASEESKRHYQGDGESAEVWSRLLTLTGSGGTGKTRLALQTAHRMIEIFPDGIWLVDMGSLTESALVAQTAAAVFGVQEEQNRPVTASLAAYLRPKKTLLIFDNCEHLIEDCAQLAEALLTSCPQVYLLTTSREALCIPGEVTLQISPLPFPEPGTALSIEALTKYEAVQLFLDRAKAVYPGLQVSEQNLSAIAQVCQQLDGIPLAIELAAAQMRLLRVEQISARLEDRFGFLKAGSRTAKPRQQTLKAMIDWSYDLLSGCERVLFRRLGVFIGGWTLGAAEAVCADRMADQTYPEEGPAETDEEIVLRNDVIHCLNQLINKSLVLVEGRQEEEIRYRYLETIRHYAKERLSQDREAEQIYEAHRSWYLEFVRRAESELQGPNQAAWLEKVESEHDNIRGALKWTLREEVCDAESGLQDAEAGLQMAGCLWRFWDTRGYVSEGRRWLKRALEKSVNHSEVRVKALIGAGFLAIRQSDSNRSLELIKESLALSHEIGYRAGVAESLFSMHYQVEMKGWPRERKEALVQESLAIWREIGDRRGIATALGPLASIATERFDYPQASTFFEESLALFRALGDEREVAGALWNLGEVAQIQGDYGRAKAFYEESQEIYEGLKDTHGVATQMRSLGEVFRNLGELDKAKGYFDESIPIFRDIGDRGCMAFAMAGLGLVACNMGEVERAMQLIEESREIFKDIEWKVGVAFALERIGRVYILGGQIAQAQQVLCEGLELACEASQINIEVALVELLARIAQQTGEPKRAARLIGAAEAWRESIHTPIPNGDRDEFEKWVNAIREDLGEQVFNEEQSLGRAMILEGTEKVIELAISKAQI